MEDMILIEKQEDLAVIPSEFKGTIVVECCTNKLIFIFQRKIKIVPSLAGGEISGCYSILKYFIIHLF